MSDKKPNKPVNIYIGNYVGGDVTGSVGNGSTVININGAITINDDSNTIIINPTDPFYAIYSKIALKPEPDRKNLINEVEPIRQETQKKKDIQPEFLQKRLINLAKMAPDIFEVVVATLTNPIHGFSTIVSKIAQKVQNEYGQMSKE